MGQHVVSINKSGSHQAHAFKCRQSDTWGRCLLWILVGTPAILTEVYGFSHSVGKCWASTLN